MEDPRTKFFETIDLTKSRVNRFPGFVFVCGGSIEDIKDHPSSARDAVVRFIYDKSVYQNLQKHLIQAEEIKDWLEESIYTDLISFERDLAELASVVVLFVESPGSIAELGAFSVVDQIAKKLLVFIRDKSYQQDSFISLGPIKYLQNERADINDEVVRVYPWKLAVPNENSDFGPVDISSIHSFASDICNDILEASIKANKSHQFSEVLPGHVMLLICDLIDISLALKQTEILQYLNTLGIAIDTKKLRQYLFILEKFQLILLKNYGGHYYIANDNAPSFMKFSFKEGFTKPDRISAKIQTSAYYAEHDKPRYKALRYYKTQLYEHAMAINNQSSNFDTGSEQK